MPSSDEFKRDMERSREGLLEAIRDCAGCGAKLLHPEHSYKVGLHQTNYPDDEGLAGVTWKGDGFVVQSSALGPPDSYPLVCRDRGRRGPKPECYRRAFEKNTACVMCGAAGGGTKGAWPRPCPECVAMVRRERARAAEDAARGDVIPTLVKPLVAGIFRSEEGLGEALVRMFAAFGAPAASDAERPTETISFADDPPYLGGPPAGIVVLLDRRQREAVASLLRWANVAVPRALADRFEAGASLLRGLLIGETTIEVMNDKVAAEVNRRRDGADRAERQT